MAIETTEYSLEKEMKMLETSYMMYEDSIKKTEDEMRDKLNPDTGDHMFTEKDIEQQISLLRSAQDDIVAKYVKNGGKKEDIEKKGKRGRSSLRKSKLKFSVKSEPIAIPKRVQENKKEEVLKHPKKKPVTESIVEMSSKSEVKDDKKDEKTHILGNFIPSKFENKASYDVIPLPSKGEVYKSKISKVPVSFLTAYDENMIVSPNLYRDNLVLDYILENKIMNDDIDPSLLVDGDREAILLYLRAAGYGNEYPIMAKDDKTGTEFEAIVNLADIKFKEFNLKGDENGFFDYDLPVSGKHLKFKFLNHNEMMALDKLNEAEEKDMAKEKIEGYTTEIENYLELMDDTPVKEKIKVREAISSLRKWTDGMDSKDSDKFSHYLTNKMELSIMSVDGNTDRGYISEFVSQMPVGDSSSFRKYMLKNEPGLDYRFAIQKPESLGGGSMEVFLQFDQFIFLNIPD